MILTPDFDVWIFPPHHQEIFQHKLGVQQLDAILTSSNCRWHWMPQDCLLPMSDSGCGPSRPLLPMSDSGCGPSRLLSFWPAGYRLEVSWTFSLGLMCFSECSQNLEQQFTYLITSLWQKILRDKNQQPDKETLIKILKQRSFCLYGA